MARSLSDAAHPMGAEREFLSLLTRYLVNSLWVFHQIYNFGAAVDSDELFRFWGQETKGCGHSESTYG